MLCQHCGQKEAAVHLTKIINGQKTELYLCEDCAREMGHIPFHEGDPFSFQHLLSGILSPDLGSLNEAKSSDLKCAECGLSYQKFIKQGLFGCANCYNTFKNKLNPLFKRIHGSTRHLGKVPKRRGGALRLQREIENLRQELEQAVAEEKFERAAELRDKIYALEAKLGGR